MTAFHDSTDFVNASEVEAPTVEVIYWGDHCAERFGVDVYPSMEGGVIFTYRDLEVKILNSGEVVIFEVLEDREYTSSGSSLEEFEELLLHLSSRG